MTAAETHERSATVAGQVQFRENDAGDSSLLAEGPERR